ncbi:PREDICTED: GTP-binding protein 10 homolog [Ceratosolen solmsi marchali]|uniref:GTP-binding protein 10 homolog n=1 Tax=Ceratosolen solmsi marchali TaxID=326594 RepID=A0AAJ7DSW1_9HYME|nr:PREDICTED: GTP-binding protein 10 homolog [Ceratosolen solmsi marchali]
MVYLTCILGYAKKKSIPMRNYLMSGFFDKLRFHIRAGTGGSGLSKYGGRGGRGGNIYVKSKDNVSLKDLSKYVRNNTIVAGTGYDSSKHGLLGAAGEDIIINVPAGVIVYHEDGNLIGEVNECDKKLLVALGGIGGCEETNYTGQKGESHSIILDLKLISDIILVGFPNAGKSSLIRCVSNAKPKIAAYAFTTVRPHLGKIMYDDFREITIADLPGLIEGAHKNVGMGQNVLKHLERSNMLLFVIDIQGFILNSNHKWRNCLETILLLNKEIELYKPELLDKPAMLILNKMDTENAEKICNDVLPKLKNLENLKIDFPESMFPKKCLNFQNILPMSLINKDKHEIAVLKKLIRENLDKIAELAKLEENEAMKEELTKKLKKELKITTSFL